MRPVDVRVVGVRGVRVVVLRLVLLLFGVRVVDGVPTRRVIVEPVRLPEVLRGEVLRGDVLRGDVLRGV